MVRIQHGHWVKKSESDSHDGMNATCADGGWISWTLDWAKRNGLSDESCQPYVAQDHPYSHCQDRSGRTVRMEGDYTNLTATDDVKRWISRVGPVAAILTIYPEFMTFENVAAGLVFEWNNQSTPVANHYVLVIGYDDAKRAWLIKNSWGTWWVGRHLDTVAHIPCNLNRRACTRLKLTELAAK